ncbi:MAG: glycosyltransferase 87 family protein, partial [Myxococcota bacterium]
VLLKLFPLAIAPALVRERRLWPMLGVALGVLGVCCLAFFIPNPREWQVFFEANFSGSTGGMHSGNHGVVYLLHVLGDALGLWPDEQVWAQVATTFRNVVLVSSAALVLCGRAQKVVFGVCMMLLAHFVSYIDVWEHHMSGVVLIGLVMLVALHREDDTQRPSWLIPAILVALVMLVLPTPYGLVDVDKNPRVHDPGKAWSTSVRAMLVLCKALPTLLLYTVCVREVTQEGLGWPWSITAQTSDSDTTPVQQALEGG